MKHQLKFSPPKTTFRVGMTFHRRRDPFASPSWKLLDRRYDKFESFYPERCEKTYGYPRPAIGAAVGEFLKCGDPHAGKNRKNVKTHLTLDD